MAKTSSSPPPYAPPPNASQSPPTGIPSNFQRVIQRNPIRGTFIISPELQVPEELLGLRDQCSDGGPKNLYLEATKKEVDVDIWTVKAEPRMSVWPMLELELVDLVKAVVTVRSFGGWSETPNKLRLHVGSGTSCALTVNSTSQDIHLALPSNLVGPITLNVRSNRVYFSESVRMRLVTFSEKDGQRQGFLGDAAKEGYTTRDAWLGSSLDVTLQSTGSLYLFALGEECPPAEPGGGGCIVG
ncbi:hypothetical protein EIP91_001147 [Steccherinum ochraceum]|uniref:DUF7330 domain-containing protein n=1 Tax=Steccherinum ochraceum TaxID=92696 RepID=A0A4R0REG1_9APHY|nr:hypothetical protein EIP91_001147 [Steccherinum ochraceum]